MGTSKTPDLFIREGGKPRNLLTSTIRRHTLIKGTQGPLWAKKGHVIVIVIVEDGLTFISNI